MTIQENIENKKSKPLFKNAAASKNNAGNKEVSKSNCASKVTAPTWQTRSTEQDYAKLKDPSSQKENRYGQRIDLLELTGLPEGRSLHINENPVVGDNPNRNKQHGFFFTADNCIGCHACESACSEKNENPAHIAFRSVGYVEGGSYPDYKRMNISMACNHCDDPICLKGCPTGAYTKHAEYGAVLQDSETCFGCGYCTWVCPYNAPQLDPVQGQVSKCNMCVDRLEVGLKPSCVSACVGNALDFGVIENIPENREQAKTSIPGFPDPSITQPNIRFQQIKSLPETMSRTDSAPVKYHRDEQGEFKPVVDQKKGKSMHWNLLRLSSKENPLVVFTLAAQASIGAFAIVFFADLFQVSGLKSFKGSLTYLGLMGLCLVMIGLGLFMSTMHLGKPIRFYRGFNNLRHSPVCREGLGIALFMSFLAGHILFELFINSHIYSFYQSAIGGNSELTQNPTSWLIILSKTCQYLALPCGLAGIYYMNRCYRIKARPFWDHWQVATSFFGNMLSLGAILTGALWLIYAFISEQNMTTGLEIFTGIFITGLFIEIVGLWFHAKSMSSAEHEGAASHYVQLTTFGKSYYLRNAILLAVLVTSIILWMSNSYSNELLLGWGIVSILTLGSALISRSLFYVLVIPTTMPGAFFWKNKGFEEHAREVGLAQMEQVGVK
jgi:DMSO reductase iron-sulfur subunit